MEYSIQCSIDEEKNDKRRQPVFLIRREVPDKSYHAWMASGRFFKLI
jgi:hypothetical protein